MSNLPICLVGCGRWGSLILRDLVALGCRVSVIAKTEQAKIDARKIGADIVVDSLDQIEHARGFVIATPTSTHSDVIHSILDRHVPIFVEKPMVVDYQDAAQLADLAGDRLFVMDKWRYHSGVLKLAEIAKTGQLGAIKGLKTTRTQANQPHKDVDSVWTLLPHDLAIALEILGYIPHAEHAYSTVASLPMNTLFSTCGTNPWFISEVSMGHEKARREIWLYGSDGIAHLDDSYSEHITISRGAPNPGFERISFSQEMPLLMELKAFVEHIKGGPPPKSSAQEGAEIVQRIQELRSLAMANTDTKNDN